MNVIAFQGAARPGDWRACELQQIVGALSPSVAQGHASGWETGSTEAGDPQFYLLGPEPEQACEICISRIGRVYVLEDGEGRLLGDTENLALLAERAAVALRRNRAQIVARMLLAWCVVKQFFHDRIEPLMAESEDMLGHFAPQLVALV